MNEIQKCATCFVVGIFITVVVIGLVVGRSDMMAQYKNNQKICSTHEGLK